MAEKPCFEAARIGNIFAVKPKAVKVSFGNSSTVHQILVKAKEISLFQNCAYFTGSVAVGVCNT